MPTDGEPPELPEPAALHTQFSRDHALDWGDTIPTTADITARYGPEATAESLGLLARLLPHHAATTQQLLMSLPDGADTFELNHRIKSPISLARKIWTAWHADREPLTDDVQRFTILAKDPDQLVDASKAAVRRLAGNGWQVMSAHHSYVEGSRYKGLHAGLKTTSGLLVEVQFHTPDSIRIKMATTSLYHAQRDPTVSPQARRAAGQKAVQISARLGQPPGLDDLHLGGQPVKVISYGSSNRGRNPTRGVGTALATRQEPLRRGRNIDNDGLTR